MLPRLSSPEAIIARRWEQHRVCQYRTLRSERRARTTVCARGARRMMVCDSTGHCIASARITGGQGESA
eukprot:513103-Rhodomonas_salina.1